MQSISKPQVACHPNFTTRRFPLLQITIKTSWEYHALENGKLDQADKVKQNLQISKSRNRWFVGVCFFLWTTLVNGNFLAEKKRRQSWMKKEVSRQMSWEYDFSSCEYPTAIAAAAHAIQSLEESNYWDKKKRVDEVEHKPQPLKTALKSSDEKSRSSFSDESSSSSKRMGDKKPTKKISFADMDEISNNTDNKSPFQKPPSFADEKSKLADFPKPEQRPPPLPPTTQPGPADAAADAWEKEEMISIKERYEKLRVTIDSWEMKKKKKVQLKMERTEDELGERKAKNIKKYKSEIARIEEIANGARAQAEENRRKEELKVKEKANKIRATGKIPPTCLCF